MKICNAYFWTIKCVKNAYFWIIKWRKNAYFWTIKCAENAYFWTLLVKFLLKMTNTSLKIL